jgi:hypothetical protein
MQKEYLKCSGGCGNKAGTHNASDVYCWSCGAGLEKYLKKCTVCDFIGCQADRYCTKCGTVLVEHKLPWKEKKGA